MFLIFGVTEKKKDLEFNQFHVCDVCGSYGNYEVFMVYTTLSLFFIPTIKWNKRYYARATCCGSLYEINVEAGSDIEKGIKTELKPSELKLIQANKRARRCSSCGYMVDPDFDFCPKCGKEM